MLSLLTSQLEMLGVSAAPTICMMMSCKSGPDRAGSTRRIHPSGQSCAGWKRTLERAEVPHVGTHGVRRRAITDAPEKLDWLRGVAAATALTGKLIGRRQSEPSVLYIRL